MTGSTDNAALASAQHNANKLLSSILVAMKSLGIQIGALSTTATTGSATLPGNPQGFVTLTFPDGSSGKVPYYNT